VTIPNPWQIRSFHYFQTAGNSHIWPIPLFLIPQIWTFHHDNFCCANMEWMQTLWWRDPDIWDCYLDTVSSLIIRYQYHGYGHSEIWWKRIYYEQSLSSLFTGYFHLWPSHIWLTENSPLLKKTTKFHHRELLPFSGQTSSNLQAITGNSGTISYAFMLNHTLPPEH
jgi:hypothetical protein